MSCAALVGTATVTVRFLVDSPLTRTINTHGSEGDGNGNGNGDGNGDDAGKLDTDVPCGSYHQVRNGMSVMRCKLCYFSPCHPADLSLPLVRS
jgi:hypothetical protein